MATHSSILAWRTPGTEEPGGLPSMGLHRVGHDWSDLAAAASPPSMFLLGNYPDPGLERGWDTVTHKGLSARLSQADPALPEVSQKCCSVAKFFANPWTVAHQDPLSCTVFQSLFKFPSIEAGTPSRCDVVSLWRPLSLCLQSFPASQTSPPLLSLWQVSWVSYLMTMSIMVLTRL